MSLSPELRQRILEAAKREPTPSRRQVRSRYLVLWGLAVATTLALFFLVGGRGMLGRARGWLLAVAIVTPLAFLAWKLGWSGQYEHMTDAWASRPGYRCFALTFVFALLPLGALLLMRRSSDPTHPRSLGLALGVAAGTMSAALVDLWCPVGHLTHLLAGHILPTALLGLLGAWIGQRLLGIRSSR